MGVHMTSLWLQMNFLIIMTGAQECATPVVFGPDQSWHPLKCQQPTVPNGTLCSVICLDSYVMGPTAITCREGKWEKSQGVSQETLCVDVKTLAEDFRYSLIQLVLEENYWGTLFVVDVSTRNPEDYFRYISLLMKRLVSEIVSIPGKTAGLISFDDNARKVLTLDKSNPCEFRDVLIKQTDEGKTRSNYQKALELVTEEISSQTRRSVIVFIVANPDSGTVEVSMKMANELISAGHALVVIGMETIQRAILEPIASTGHDTLLLYYLKRFTDLKIFAENFDRPCKGLQRSRNLIWVPASCTRQAVDDGSRCHAFCKASPIVGPKVLRCDGGVWMSADDHLTCGVTSHCQNDPPAPLEVAGLGLPTFNHTRNVAKPLIYPDNWFPQKPIIKGSSNSTGEERELRGGTIKDNILPGASILKEQDVHVDKVVPKRQNLNPWKSPQKSGDQRWGISSSISGKGKNISDFGREIAHFPNKDKCNSSKDICRGNDSNRGENFNKELEDEGQKRYDKGMYKDRKDKSQSEHINDVKKWQDGDTHTNKSPGNDSGGQECCGSGRVDQQTDNCVDEPPQVRDRAHRMSSTDGRSGKGTTSWREWSCRSKSSNTGWGFQKDKSRRGVIDIRITDHRTGCHNSKLHQDCKIPEYYSLDITKKMKKGLQHTLNNPLYNSVVFLLHEHVPSAETIQQSVKKFAVNVIYAHPIMHRERSSPVFNFSSLPTQLVASESHPCFFYEQLMTMSTVKSEQSKLVKILQAAEAYIRRTNETTIVSLVMHGTDEGPPTRLMVVSKQKKLGAMMYVIAVYDFNLKQLLAMAPTGKSGKRLLFPFPDYEMVQHVAKDLRTHFKKISLSRCTQQEHP